MSDDALIEAYLADALAPAERRSFLARVAAEPALATRFVAATELEALLHDAHRIPAQRQTRGPRLRRAVAATLAAAALLIAVVLLVAQDTASAPSWRVVALSGEVLHRTAGQIAPQPASSGGQLLAGDRLHLGHGAQLRVRDARGTSWRLTGPARLTLGEEPGLLRMQRGTLAARIERPRSAASPFTIVSPHGRVSAVGTRFRFRVAAQRSLLYVDQGTVAARCAGATPNVHAGQHLVLDDRSSGIPRPTAPAHATPLVHYDFSDYADGRVNGDGDAPPLRADNPYALEARPGAVALPGDSPLRSEAAIPELDPLLGTPGRWTVALWLEAPRPERRIERLVLFTLSQPDTNGTMLHRRIFTADAAIFATARDDGLVHLVLIQDGNDIRVHVNGEAGAFSTGGPLAASSEPVHLVLPGLALNDDTTLPWPVVYHDLAIYSRVLEPASIRALHRAGPEGIPPAP